METSRLPLIAIGALILLAVVVAVAMGLGGAEEFDPGTPEAALQDYLDAAIDADGDAVLELLTTQGRQNCADRIGDQLWSPSGIGFSLDSLQREGSTATAVVNQRRSNRDPFGGGGSTNQEEFMLARANDGTWRIAEASWPWPVKNCLGERA